MFPKMYVGLWYIVYRVDFTLQVVDARAGPGTKSTLKIKNKLSPSMHKYKSPLKSKRSSQTFRSIPSPGPDDLSGKAYVQIRTFYERKIVIIFLPINLNMCFGCSKEPSHWDGSFKHPHHMFWLINKKMILNDMLGHFQQLMNKIPKKHLLK